MTARFQASKICSAVDLRRHLAKGEGLALGDFQLDNPYQCAALSLRDLAIRENAPLSVHRLLDEIGEAYVSEDLASRLGVLVIDRGKYLGLCELRREHPEALVRWMTEYPAPAAQKILYRYLEGKYHPAQTKKMLLLATELGANWSLYRNGVEQIMKKQLGKYDETIVQMQAHALAHATPQPSSTSSRPRL